MRWHAFVVALHLVVLAGSVAAQNTDSDRADALFKRGKKLMDDRRYPEACRAFEESFKLDPGIGAELNVARCYAEWGKLRRAYRAYKHADDMASEENDSREPEIADRVNDIEPQVPRLTIKLSSGAAPQKLAVLVDGEQLDSSSLGKARQVDPGPHTIEWTVDGAPKQTKVVAVERRGRLALVLDVASASAASPSETSRDDRVDVRRHHRVEVHDDGGAWRAGAYVSGGIGVVLIGVSGFIAVSARNEYNNALAAHCGGKTNDCDPTGVALTYDAISKADVATGTLISGVAAIGAGVALYLLAPHASRGEHALRIVPRVDGRGGGLALDGRF